MAREIIFRESAQVQSSLTDLSQVSTTPAYAFLALVTATKGELNKPILINGMSESQLEAAFGKPTIDHLGLVCAAKLIKAGLNGYLVRVAGSSLASATTSITCSTGSITATAKNRGTDGNGYKLAVAAEAGDTGMVNITIFKDGVAIETLKVSTDEASPDYILDVDNEVIEFSSEDYTSGATLSDGDYQLAGGNDGVADITAEDYIGASVDGVNTGVYCFLNKKYAAQFIATFGFTDKKLAVAMKSVADARKDITVVIDTPPGLTKKQAEDWREATGDYEGTPFLEGFNMELYWDWQKDYWEGQEVVLPPSVYVLENSLKSYPKNGPWLPVAGDARGVITSADVVTRIDSVTDRDSLVSHNINPIYDTGYRGIQIYGNETLNKDYTDLSAAHIGRTLTHIRGHVDELTEGFKFGLNNEQMWSTWEATVNEFLQDIKLKGGLQFYRATMGGKLTSREELAQRICRAQIELQFTPDGEVFKLEYVVYASSEVM